MAAADSMWIAIRIYSHFQPGSARFTVKLCFRCIHWCVKLLSTAIFTAVGPSGTRASVTLKVLKFCVSYWDLYIAAAIRLFRLNCWNCAYFPIDMAVMPDGSAAQSV